MCCPRNPQYTTAERRRGLLLQTEWRGLSVCRSVFLLCIPLSLAKMAEPIWVLFGYWLERAEGNMCRLGFRISLYRGKVCLDLPAIDILKITRYGAASQAVCELDRSHNQRCSTSVATDIESVGPIAEVWFFSRRFSYDFAWFVFWIHSGLVVGTKVCRKLQ